MIEKIKKIEFTKGDKVLWIAIILVSLSSLLVVYSASDNLLYLSNGTTTFEHLRKHAIHILVGLLIVKGIEHFFNSQFISVIAPFGLLAAFIALVIAMYTGTTIGGASAGRWIKIGGISFQPSSFAYVAIILYICKFLTHPFNKRRPWYHITGGLFLPLFVIIGLTGKENGSTGALMFATSTLIMIVGGLPWKHIRIFIGTAIVGLLAFFGAVKMGLIENNRVDTWISRIEVFLGNKEKLKERNIDFDAKNYQTDLAKSAIVHGGFFGVGPGKSAMKQSLPQSTSDFIFAIVIEEYGLMGALFLLLLYMVIIIRMLIISYNTPSEFQSLLVISFAIMFMLQVMVNVAVATNIGPVTGQPLPLISAGGTSVLAIYIVFGLILNISTRIPTKKEEGIGKKQSIENVNDIA